MDPSVPIARFENVGLRYGLGPEVLQDVTFELDPGSYHFLVGPSGAGKSSLLKLMMVPFADKTHFDLSLLLKAQV